jgi:(p)ppGpp synthase/HD superfamily hydrolase
MMTLSEWRQYCYNRHDVEVNQKYGNDVIKLPYSFHLYAVEAQAQKFKHIIMGSEPISTITDIKFDMVAKGCIGHDLIDDARLCYSDIKRMTGKHVADIIYLCSDMRGKSRSERHSDEFFKELAKNERAVFVKLCDVIANSLFGVTTNSDMVNTLKSEYSKFKELCYYPQHEEMWEYLASIYQLKK